MRECVNGLAGNKVPLPFRHLPTHSNDPLHCPLEEVTYWPMCLQRVDCHLSMLGSHLLGVNQGTKVFISLKALGHLPVSHALDLG